MYCKLNMQDSWSDMHDDFMDIVNTSPKKEVLGSSSVIDSIGIGIKTSSLKLTQKLSEFDRLNTSTVSTASPVQLSLGEILTIDVSKGGLSEIELLKHQTYVTGQLKKYVGSCIDNSSNFDVEQHLPKLEWLAKSCLYLAKKRLQKDIKFKKKLDHIQRNSYEFCEYGPKCPNSNGKCKKKHIVYNYAYCDISELIRHLTTNLANTANTTNLSIKIKDIFTSINTINYVFNHMYDELANT